MESEKMMIQSTYSSEQFEAKYTYTGDDLGATWTPERTFFRVWAPTADAVSVCLYRSGTKGTADQIAQLAMTPDVNGTWTATKDGDLNGIYYTYLVTVDGRQTEACDPYARTTGVNGKRAMILDPASTNPAGWDADCNPNAGMAYTDAIIYELHVRDLSVNPASGITHAGKFLGLTETGTKTPSGIPTGLDHMKDLGITHLHLLPVYDYASVDESKTDAAQFNWGYDPENYNVPEGSYSTDPFHGEVRVAEMKQMIKALHDNGISIILDVVYNHVYSAADFCMNQIVPGYFSRISDDGVYSNGSECGNDTASERSMVRKFIVDSVKYWTEEYHVDGFRFDLVGLIDTDTINELVREVHAIRPDVIFYGEGWSMNTVPTKKNCTLTTQTNSDKVPGFAFFSDTLRDALKGHVFDTWVPGYVSGADGLSNAVKNCFLGQAGGWCHTPLQSVNYASCHDNMTLFDRITRSTPDATDADRIRMNKLAAVIYITAQGIPFLQAGEEMLRIKRDADGSIVENSYNAPDSVNCLKWNCLEDKTHQNIYEYYKGLIAFRKVHALLRLKNPTDIAAHITCLDTTAENVLAFHLHGSIAGETAQDIILLFNPTKSPVSLPLPDGTFNICVDDQHASTTPLATVTGLAQAAPISALILTR